MTVETNPTPAMPEPYQPKAVVPPQPKMSRFSSFSAEEAQAAADAVAAEAAEAERWLAERDAREAAERADAEAASEAAVEAERLASPEDELAAREAARGEAEDAELAALVAEREAAERAELELEQSRLAAAQAEAERLDAEWAAEQAARERAAAERAEADAFEAELAAEQAERDAEQARRAVEEAEAAQITAERLDAERAEAVRVAAQVEALRLDAERMAAAESSSAQAVADEAALDAEAAAPADIDVEDLEAEIESLTGADLPAGDDAPDESEAQPTAAEVQAVPRAELEGEEIEPPLSVIPFLRALSELSGSDLHVKVGASPRIRIDGRLRRLKCRDLTPADTQHMLDEVIREDVVREFAETNEGDFAFSLAGVGRFRVNAYRARGSIGLVFRRVSVGAIALTDLGVPEVIASLALEPRGLVLVTGPTGSGKTTTLAGMVDHINTTKEVHIVTIEDPIEVMHVDKNSIINQREVGLDTRNFAVALRAAMRQDPDVVLVGEMRDAETVGASLSASETGHFVMSTLHTTDAAETITRVIDFFPPHEQKQVRLSLSAALKGIVCQRLVPRADGQGRVVVMEICVNNGRIADAIADPEKTHMITDLIREGTFYGMQTFDQHLVALYRDSVVTLEDAMHASSNPHDLQVELRAQGLL